jgi:hypothetical protein
MNIQIFWGFSSREDKIYMSRIGGLFTLGSTMLLACCLVGASPNFAAAQSADSQGEWQLSPGPVAPSSAVRTATDYSGCWSGDISDSSGNSGTGFIFFVQNRNKKHVTKASSAGLAVDTYQPGSAPITGNVKGSTFKLQHVGHHCKVALQGGPGSATDEIVGTYRTSKRCLGDGVKHTGSFDYFFDTNLADCNQ